MAVKFFNRPAPGTLAFGGSASILSTARVWKSLGLDDDEQPSLGIWRLPRFESEVYRPERPVRQERKSQSYGPRLQLIQTFCPPRRHRPKPAPICYSNRTAADVEPFYNGGPLPFDMEG
jgi:hypothetical protein